MDEMNINAEQQLTIERLQKALEQAPHAEDCASTFVSWDAVEHECDCWKRDALSASPPEAPAPHLDTIRLDKLENANSPFNPSMPLIWVVDAMRNSKIGVRAAIDEVFGFGLFGGHPPSASAIRRTGSRELR